MHFMNKRNNNNDNNTTATTTTTTKTTKSNSEPFYFRKLSVKNVNFTNAFLQGVDSFKK